MSYTINGFTSKASAIRHLRANGHAICTILAQPESNPKVAKNGKELKRDMEATICALQAEAAGDVSTARTLGALPSWVITNTDIGKWLWCNNDC